MSYYKKREKYKKNAEYHSNKVPCDLLITYDDLCKIWDLSYFSPLGAFVRNYIYSKSLEEINDKVKEILRNE